MLKRWWSFDGAQNFVSFLIFVKGQGLTQAERVKRLRGLESLKKFQEFWLGPILFKVFELCKGPETHQAQKVQKNIFKRLGKGALVFKTFETNKPFLKNLTLKNLRTFNTYISFKPFETFKTRNSFQGLGPGKPWKSMKFLKFLEQ